MVSCLCGVLTRRKTLAAKKVPNGDGTLSLPGSGAAAAQTPSADSAAGVADNGRAQLSSVGSAPPPPSGDQQQPRKQLPPPPGRCVSAAGHPLRSSACLHLQHSRSSSAAAPSKLISSMSMRVLGSGGAVVGGGRGRRNDKKFNDDDSIWKKRIILGEKCRVPDEDEDAIFYDEDGNRFSTYHPRTHSGALSITTTTSCINTNHTTTTTTDNNNDNLSSK